MALNFARTITKGHASLYRMTKGRIGGRIGKAPVLVLTSVGHKSGKTFATPLVYLHDARDYIVIASNAGKANDPNWWANLKAHAHTTIEIGGARIEVDASEVTGAERDRLYAEAVRLYKGYDKYQRATTRIIPVVRLTPTPAP